MAKSGEVKYRFGLTGTLDGTQTHRLVLEGLFGQVKKIISTKELIDRGTLAKLEIDCIVLKHTEEEAKNVVKAGKFPPIGARGMFPGRQSYGVKNYYTKANDETFLTVLIEDIVAIENLASILSVKHIDVFCVAPGDLAASMGHIGSMDHPTVKQKIDDALLQIIQAGRIAGTLATEDNIEHYHDLGVRFFLTPIQSWIADGIARITSKIQ